jgi:hypothetical protein
MKREREFILLVIGKTGFGRENRHASPANTLPEELSDRFYFSKMKT